MSCLFTKHQSVTVQVSVRCRLSSVAHVDPSQIKAKRLRNTDLAQTITFAQTQCVFSRERKSVPESGKSFISENNETPPLTGRQT